MEDTLLIEKHEDGIAEIVLNKPRRRNALDPHMMERLAEWLQGLDADNEVKVIILKGQGDHFCAGGDLKAGAGKTLTIEDSRNSLKKYGRVIQVIQQMEKPVIAMVKGYAVGGGMSLALACDIILAADDARFSANFLKVGIVPEMGAMLFLPQTIGLYRAKELWFTGRVVGADEAFSMGWVNHVYPAQEIERETLAFAQTVAQMPAVSLRITKRITNSHINSMLNAVLEAEAQASPLCSQTEEFKLYRDALRNK